MTWLEGKASTGSSRFPKMTGPPVYRKESLGSEDNWNPAQPRDTPTGSLSAEPEVKFLYEELKNSLETPAMPSFQDPKPRPRMFGKTRQPLMEPDLNSAKNPLTEAQVPTGTPSGNLQHEVTSYPFQPTFEFVITELSEASVLTLRNQLEWSELATFSLVRLELANQNWRGNGREWTLTLKIPTQNSGAVTVANALLSSMNFEVESMSHTFSDGSIDILAMWKSKDLVCRYVVNPFSSLPTWKWTNGIPN
jgi:hypothetical protein